ncbi:hypothetical protein [Haloarchaeobius sp. DFWS5]|uniref:hypothetical protein n=1 Tax=Haloarchaeobius sp. DFWS5 TaxID=3446114 RepID=UPI003EBB6314
MNTFFLWLLVAALVGGIVFIARPPSDRDSTSSTSGAASSGEGRGQSHGEPVPGPTQSLTDEFDCRFLDVTDEGIHVAVTDGDDAARLLVTGYDDDTGRTTAELVHGRAGPRREPVTGPFPGPPGYLAPSSQQAPANGARDGAEAAGIDDATETDEWDETVHSVLEAEFTPIFDVRDALPKPGSAGGDDSDSAAQRARRERFDHSIVGDYPDGTLLEVTDGDRLARVLVSDDEPARPADPSSADDWVAEAVTYADSLALDEARGAQSTTHDREPAVERD